MARIGLFGGSFNPVHVAHLALAESAREEGRLDRVIFMPARVPPHKPFAPLAASQDRLEMLRLALADSPHFEVSFLELEREGPSYTLTTVRRLKGQLGPECTLCLIVGADSVCDMPKWWRARELVQEVELIGLRRPGSPPVCAAGLEEHFGAQKAAEILESIIDGPLLEVSATEVRARVRRGRSIRCLVPEPVREYILAHGLYTGG